MFPVEILDHIFGHLQSDPAALKSCSKAHPLFLQIAERHIYAEISVVVPDSVYSLELARLSNDISANPHIANYVRTVSIEVKYPPRNSATLDEVSRILPLFTRLKSITLKRCSLRVDRVEWGLLNKRFRSAFLDCLRLSSMKEVSILGAVGFPLSALEDCKSIHNVALDHWIDSAMSLDTKSMSSYPLLKTLSISSCNGPKFIAWVKRRIDGLDFLRFRSDESGYTNLLELLPACASSLTRLELKISNLFSTSYLLDQEITKHRGFPFSLSDLNHLKLLIIHALVYAAYHNTTVFNFSLPAVSQLIKTAAPSLECVILRFHFRLDQIRLLSGLNWSPLVHLADSPSCPHIELFISGRETSSLQSFPPEIILESLANHEGLMSMVSKGLLVIKPVIDNPDSLLYTPTNVWK